MKYPASIKNLVEHFSDLPTVGPKTAERYVFYLLKQNPEKLQKFAQDLAELKEKTTVCQTCFSYAEKNPCPICGDGKRDKGILCLVANTRDMLTLESTGKYSGVYHVLGGVINTLEGINPEQLNINILADKIKSGTIREVIIALSPNLEGETTSMYLAKFLKPHKIKITRLAKGLPMGADLEYADELTLINALKYRNEIQ